MITCVELSDRDIIVMKIPVGNMPPQRVKDYLEAIKADVRTLLGTNQPIFTLVLKTRDAEPDICIIKRV